MCETTFQSKCRLNRQKVEFVLHLKSSKAVYCSSHLPDDRQFLSSARWGAAESDMFSFCSILMWTLSNLLPSSDAKSLKFPTFSSSLHAESSDAQSLLCWSSITSSFAFFENSPEKLKFSDRWWFDVDFCFTGFDRIFSIEKLLLITVELFPLILISFRRSSSFDWLASTESS